MRRTLFIDVGFVYRLQLFLITFLLFMGLLVYLARTFQIDEFTSSPAVSEIASAARDSNRDSSLLSQFGHFISKEFDVGLEGNIPTFWSSFNMLFACFLCLFCGYFGASNQRISRYWFLLALAMLALSVDEFIEIHERLGMLLSFTAIDIPFLKQNYWVVPGALIVMLFALYFIPFLSALPTSTRIGVISSGAIFVLGAVGMEGLGGAMLTSGEFSRQDFIYDVRRLLEEGLEMYGIVLFNYVLLRYLETQAQHIHITFGSKTQR